ncbi:hypothetical protein [Tranquillimonas rosea]|uniref:hypothetical protein n=1 Tax=Tranquillimonas rosea TaxID=641238 RepID=UPI003BAC241E
MPPTWLARVSCSHIDDALEHLKAIAAPSPPRAVARVPNGHVRLDWMQCTSVAWCD